MKNEYCDTFINLFKFIYKSRINKCYDYCKEFEFTYDDVVSYIYYNNIILGNNIFDIGLSNGVNIPNIPLSGLCKIYFFKCINIICRLYEKFYSKDI